MFQLKEAIISMWDLQELRAQHPFNVLAVEERHVRHVGWFNKTFSFFYNVNIIQHGSIVLKGTVSVARPQNILYKEYINCLWKLYLKMSSLFHIVSIEFCFIVEVRFPIFCR